MFHYLLLTRITPSVDIKWVIKKKKLLRLAEGIELVELNITGAKLKIVRREVNKWPDRLLKIRI